MERTERHTGIRAEPSAVFQKGYDVGHKDGYYKGYYEGHRAAFDEGFAAGYERGVLSGAYLGLFTGAIASLGCSVLFMVFSSSGSNGGGCSSKMG